MITLNRAALRDKIYACWIGKNIGGTMGTPYEGRREINDIQGFVTKPGEVLPNDDLDLQMIWLRVIEEDGPYLSQPSRGGFCGSRLVRGTVQCGVRDARYAVR